MAQEFFGERLRLARLLNLMTQAELAASVGVTRQFIHALEIGDKNPSNDLLLAFCLPLNVTAKFFSKPSLTEVKEEQCHFRSRKTTPLAHRQQFIAHGTLFNSLIKHLETELTLPKVDIPHFDISRSKDIDEGLEEAALRTRNYWGLGDGPITNMCRVLEKKAGAVITRFPGISEKVDALSVSAARPIVVQNPEERSPARARFSLAHECGHLVVHFGIETGDDVTEAQANRFASAFLLPRTTFTSDFPQRGRFEWGKLYEMKKTWGVSVAAILRRAKDLGLIDDTLYFRGNAYLSKSGQKKQELYEDVIAPERPGLLRNALVAYQKGRAGKTNPLTEAMQISPNLLRRLAGDDLSLAVGPTVDSTVVNIGDFREKRQAPN
jgi:Zn-dependent peptidase ImmA (M78 family)/transcriptional regulator with XRE-family HTH domain